MSLRRLPLGATLIAPFGSPALADPGENWGGIPKGHLAAARRVPRVDSWPSSGPSALPTNCGQAQAEAHRFGGFVIQGRPDGFEYRQYYEGDRFRRCKAEDFFKGKC
jgi:hypothetical protein